jgi:hypothetical protein
LDIGWPTERLNVCGEAHFSHSASASTLKPGDTEVTLNFGKAWLKKDKKTLSMQLFRECQAAGRM